MRSSSRYSPRMTSIRTLLLAAALPGLVACSNPPTPPTGAPLSIKHDRALGTFTLPVWQVAFSPDGQMLAGAGADGVITIWSWPDGAMRRTLRHNGGATGLAFSPDGAHLATSGYDAAVRIWRLTDGQPVRKLDGATVHNVPVAPSSFRTGWPSVSRQMRTAAS